MLIALEIKDVLFIGFNYNNLLMDIEYFKKYLFSVRKYLVGLNLYVSYVFTRE